MTYPFARASTWRYSFEQPTSRWSSIPKVIQIKTQRCVWVTLSIVLLWYSLTVFLHVCIFCTQVCCFSPTWLKTRHPLDFRMSSFWHISIDMFNAKWLDKIFQFLFINFDYIEKKVLNGNIAQIFCGHISYFIRKKCS